MAKVMYSPQGPELLDALRAMGVDPCDTRRVVIDIRTGHATMIYVERMADERIIDVVRILADDPHVRVNREPTDNCQDCNHAISEHPGTTGGSFCHGSNTCICSRTETELRLAGNSTLTADVERAIADPSSMVYRDRPRRQVDDDWSIVVRPQDPGIVHVWCGNAQLHDAAPLSAHAARLMGRQLMIAAREAERGT